MGTKDRLTLTLLLLMPPACGYAQSPAASAMDFRADVQPILMKNCQGCHNGDAAPAGLRLDTMEGLVAGSESGKVVLPGKAAASLLVQRISAGTMPPSGRLSDADIKVIAAWIDQGAKAPASLPADFYTTKVQPLLASSCYACHSGTNPKGELDLSAKTLAMKGGSSGPVIVPGKSGDSRLIRRVSGLGNEPQMPFGKKPLMADQIAVLRRWIDEGAHWPDSPTTVQVSAPKHWAYVKPIRPRLPTVNEKTWVRNPVDQFVLARLEKEGLKPSPEASKETLIRRVSLDLIGLPPTPADVDAYLADKHADAYERLVDRLLASPRYGERWATPWLDLARYGDSNGWRNDVQREAWPYRDWVIRALNQNMPFDEFTIEQLAGDLLPNATSDQKIATGFVRASPLLDEAGTDPEEDNWDVQLDRASTVGTVWMGSTIACAQCHNHKYDPFTQKQFYQMVAFFNNVDFVHEDDFKITDKRLLAFREPLLKLPTDEQTKTLRALDAQLRDYEHQLNDNTPEFQINKAKWEQQVLKMESHWQPLRAIKPVSLGGAVLTQAADGSILASGKNPDSDTYVLESKSPVDEISAIRIEAMPDSHLPAGGPGRDYYGNFMIHEVSIEAGPSVGQLSKIPVSEVLRDDPAPRVVDPFSLKQIWAVDATRQLKDLPEPNGAGLEGRVRVQLLLIPAKPFRVGSDGVLRVTVVQKADVTGANLGHFRLSATGVTNPQLTVSIPAALRPILGISSERRTPAQDAELAAHYRTIAPELAPVREKIAEVKKAIEDLNIPSTLVMAENSKVLHPSAYTHVRGAFVSKGELVQADVPSFLGSLPAGAPPNRLGLAKWLVSRDNPLTARVTVNHFWEAIFGRGIVETTEDFGTQGSAPSHPKLLDWMAVQLMDSGWDIKALLRLVVTSSTYRQSSFVTPELLDRDPANILFARGPRFRVEAEMVRDIAMAESGLLSPKMFGPPIMPYQPAGLWDGIPGYKYGHDWTLSPGEDRYRRGLYIFIRRSVRYPSLTVFDAPSREVCIARRPHSDTPLQALTSLNDPAFFEAARGMANRILTEGGSTATERATYGFRLVTSRKPAPQELDTLLSSLEEQRQYYMKHPEEAEKLTSKRDASLAAWTMLSNALLNLDEALTKE